MLKYYRCLLVTALVMAQPCVAQKSEVRSDTLTARLGRLVDELDRPASPGAAFAIVCTEKPPLVRTFGHADLESGMPITPATVFDAASLAKQFTAVAIARLATDGALSLDDRIRSHLPELPAITDSITIRQLIGHTSGLRDWVQTLALAGWRSGDLLTSEDVLEMVQRQQALNFEPGTEFMYSNTGYVVLAAVVERLAGKPLSVWARDEIFSPLGMQNTRFVEDPAQILPGRAESYGLTEKGAYERRLNGLAVPGSSSLFTTIEDLATWAQELLAPHDLDNALHHRLYEEGTLSSGEPTGYGSGLHLTEFRGLRMIAHDGSWAGYRSLVAVFPEAGFGVVVLTNSASIEATDLGVRLTDIYLGRDLVLAEDAPPEPPTEPADSGPAPPVSPPADQLRLYEGVYHSPELETDWKIHVVEGRLRAKHRRRGTVLLTHVEEERFQGDTWFFRDVQFERSPEGCVIGLRVSASRIRDVWFRRTGPGVDEASPCPQ